MPNLLPLLKLQVMVAYKRSSTAEELGQILKLQQENLPSRLSVEERKIEGFVTVEHTLELLGQMNVACPHIIAKDEDKLIGYSLCMYPKFSRDIEVLKPMFDQITMVLPKRSSYIVMGQICIDKAYRKKGVFRGMYDFYRAELCNEYDCVLTEVASNNLRSLNAHRTIGFETIKSHQADNISWELLKWDWESNYQ